MSFGTPAQSFLIDIDTGSNDLWVIGKECGRDCPGSEKFDPLASSTSLTNGAIYSVRYRAGQVSGRYPLDTVGIAGYQLQNQSFAIIEKKDAAVLGAEGESSALLTSISPFNPGLTSSHRLESHRLRLWRGIRVLGGIAHRQACLASPCTFAQDRCTPLHPLTWASSIFKRWQRSIGWRCSDSWSCGSQAVLWSTYVSVA